MKKSQKNQRGALITLSTLVIILTISNFLIYIYMQGQINNLQTQADNLDAIVSLAKWNIIADHQTVNQPPNRYKSWNFQADYAGYISVSILSSNSTKMYVEVVYYSLVGYKYDENKTSPSGFTQFLSVFPICPAQVEVRVGNTNSDKNVSATVMITYYY